METFLSVVTIAASIHAFSFARWLTRQGNKPGAILAIFLILLPWGVIVYRLMTAP